MKKLYFLLLSASILYFGACQQQQKDIQEKELTSNSGELEFGDKKVTYFVQGKGIPVLICDYGTEGKYYYSENLRDQLQFVHIDLRTTNIYNEPRDYSTITLDTLLSDVDSVRSIFNFEKAYVLGHSVAGQLAIEYARKYPERTLGVIALNTAPYFDQNLENYMKVLGENWEKNASEERKQVYENNQKHLSEIKDSVPPESLDFLWIEAGNPRRFFNLEYDISEIWPNYHLNREGLQHNFNFIWTNNDILRTRIESPIFLSLGKFDFVIPQIMWDGYEDKMEKLTIHRFEKSGHLPFVEEQELFDKLLLEWINSN